MALAVESINEQFITIGTEDYDLVIDITGNPDTVKATGHMEGFSQNWDAVKGQLHIKSEEVTRLINGVNWDIEVVKDTQTLMGQVAYNVVRAAPIFATLKTINLYRGVPINFDIIIQNIPPLLIPDAELLGLKSELLAYGLNIKGKISTTDHFSFSSGNVTITVPSETGGTDTVYNYPYEIKTGSPPVIGTPKWTPNGNFGVLEVDDVTHALGYEWTVDTGDVENVDWHFFDDARPVINPGEIEVTPGTLNVTIKFPNIAGASSYEYQLVTENIEGNWIPFTGTLVNNFIRTIIPDIQENVKYTLRLRVASPWVGPPISIPITGGRLCYMLQINTSDRDNQWLYMFTTGHPNASTAPRVKRLLLPTSLSRPENGGLAVNSDGDVFILNLHGGTGNEKALYVFEADTIANAADGSRLTQDRKNAFPSAALSGTSLSAAGMDAYGGELYIDFRTASTTWKELSIVPIPDTNGTELTRRTGTQKLTNQRGYGVSVTAESIWYTILHSGSNYTVRPLDRTLFILRSTLFLRNAGSTGSLYNGGGFEVIGNDFYVLSKSGAQLQRFRPNLEIDSLGRPVLDFYLQLPSGLTRPRFLSIIA